MRLAASDDRHGLRSAAAGLRRWSARALMPQDAVDAGTRGAHQLLKKVGLIAACFADAPLMLGGFEQPLPVNFNGFNRGKHCRSVPSWRPFQA